MRLFYIVRHGESLYNQWRRQSFTHLRFRDMLIQDPGIYDAPLSPLGIEQAQKLQGKLQDNIIICSPLERAIKTAKIAFPRSRIIPHPCCAEQYDTASDAGKSLTVIKQIYPDLDYTYWEKDLELALTTQDNWWWQGETCKGTWLGLWRETKSESLESLDKRIECLEKLIFEFDTTPVIVGHSYFFRRWLREHTKLPHCEPLLVTLTDERGVIKRAATVD